MIFHIDYLQTLLTIIFFKTVRQYLKTLLIFFPSLTIRFLKSSTKFENPLSFGCIFISFFLIIKPFDNRISCSTSSRFKPFDNRISCSASSRFKPFDYRLSCSASSSSSNYCFFKPFDYR